MESYRIRVGYHGKVVNREHTNLISPDTWAAVDSDANSDGTAIIWHADLGIYVRNNAKH